MTAPFAQWHAEATEALEAARAELAVHEAERDQAQLDARAARADKAAVAKQFALIAPRQLCGVSSRSAGMGGSAHGRGCSPAEPGDQRDRCNAPQGSGPRAGAYAARTDIAAA